MSNGAIADRNPKAAPRCSINRDSYAFRAASAFLIFLACAGALFFPGARAQGWNWPSGNDSPVHDSDRLTPVSGKTAIIENDDVRLGFDSVSGALVQFEYKKTGWKIQTAPELAESFRIFAPTAQRSYNPILGARNQLSAIEKAPDGQSLKLVWRSLKSEYRGMLDMTLTGTVSLDGPEVNFDLQVQNNSGLTISSIDWPVIGSLGKPKAASDMRRMANEEHGGREVPIYPVFRNEMGYWGTNFPIQMGAGRYNLVLAGDQGIYLGTHDTSYQEVTRYTFELKPGYSDSFDDRVPDDVEISTHPVRIVTSIEHFPFVPSGETATLARIVICPFQGDWHHGADVYRRWRATWFHRPITPAWVEKVNSWQELQINSAEDDLRTKYTDLPQRAAEAAKARIDAIQIVGWAKGGQDRGLPSHDTDPRLGTHDELKQAIAKIQAMGVHVVLFNKYQWADTSTAAYDRELQNHMAHDPNGIPYQFSGYGYQTPEQLEDINTRRLAVACIPDPFWLNLSATEFRKSIDLGASGILFDDVVDHAGADYCFSHKNGQLVAKSLWAGDSMLGERLRQIVGSTVGPENFLLSGEAAYDLETRYYSLTYSRISPGYIPLARYNDPFLPMMIAVTGFDDREMINEALRYRFIISYEPFHFKGNLSDFPLTLNYGLKMDEFRKKYHEYVWDAEFRDDQDADVTVEGEPFPGFSTYRRSDGRRAVVVVNSDRRPLTINVDLGKTSAVLEWASPESPELHPFSGIVDVPARSAVVVMEQ